MQTETIGSGISTSHAFTITEAGSYTFTVKAIADRSGDYTDSNESDKSGALHTVSFETNGGTGTIPMQLVPDDGHATEPTEEPTRDGYTFDGWYKDSELNTEWDFEIDTVRDTTTLYAGWEAIYYNIIATVEDNESGTVSASADTATIGAEITLTATPAEGYHFVAWQVTPGNITIDNDGKFTMPASNVAVTAVFEEHSYDWTANGDDTHTGTCSCEATTTQACNFVDGVCSVCNYVDVTISTHPADSTIKEGETATFTVTATGDSISYQWQVNTGSGTWSDISGANSSSYTTQTATMDMEGYQYRCVVSNDTGDNATSNAATLTVNKASSEIGEQKFVRYIVEHYQKDPVSVAYSLFEREYFVGAVGNQVTATAKTYTGYAYNPTAEGTVASGTLTAITSEADIVTLKLYYDPESYSVTLNVGEGTINSGDVNEYTYGIGATLPTDVTREGYRFDGWYGNEDFTGEAVTEISATDTEDKTYYAKWLSTDARVTAVSVSGTGGEINDTTITVTLPSGSTRPTDREEVSITPADGASFSDLTTSDDGATWTFTVTAEDGSTMQEYTIQVSVQPSSGGTPAPARYTITVEDADNGSVSASASRASYGTTVTITVSPDDGYELDDLIVTDANGNEISVTKASDTRYTFTMPRSAVTVEATFTAVEDENGTDDLVFTDVSSGSYYYDAVYWAVENGVTAGTSTTTFSPDASCTRAQMVTFLWRAAGSPEPETSAMPFTDVASSAYYYDAVLWAMENGITAGTSATTFSPDLTVTRAQTATFLYRYAGSPAVSGSNPFTDVSADAYYADAVQWAASEGITAGTSTTTFSPNNDCTRAQIVTFLYRYMG